MMIRLALTGSGSPADPVRADLPTYDLIEMAPDDRAIVRVPDDAGPPDLAGATWETTADGRVLTGLPADQIDAWRARLARSYGADYRPEVG